MKYTFNVTQVLDAVVEIEAESEEEAERQLEDLIAVAGFDFDEVTTTWDLDA